MWSYVLIICLSAVAGIGIILLWIIVDMDSAAVFHRKDETKRISILVSF